MPQTLALLLGTQVVSTDNFLCGLVRSLAIVPSGPRAAHLVVEPEGRIGLGRLVPIELIGQADDDIGLTCDLHGFEALPPAETSKVVPGMRTNYVYVGGAAPPQLEVHESLPAGEEALHAGSLVRATDGPIAKVAGIVISLPEHRVESVLGSERHRLWGHKVVALPSSAVASYGADVVLSIASDEVERLATSWPVQGQH